MNSVVERAKQFVSMLRQLRRLYVHQREILSIAVGLALFALAFNWWKWLPEPFDPLIEWMNPWHGRMISSAVLIIAGAITVGYVVIRIWTQARPPKAPPEQDRPDAIKGPMAFTQADGALFRRLGREAELRQLLGYIQDDQISLVVLMGASGAGKTSLLRAGLIPMLRERGIAAHYWEAVPKKPDGALLHAICESWEDAAESAEKKQNRPQTLDDLLDQSDIGSKNRVIIVDQFEQLGGRNQSRCPVFKILHKLMRDTKPPHHVTWVVAFRREFSADWSDFINPERERGFSPRELSLRLFSRSQADEIVSVLVEQAELSVEQKVIDNLLDAATVDGEVSPVEIGIGMLVLAELVDRKSKSGTTFSIQDYKFAGGFEGLLTEYMRKKLEGFSEDDREKLLKAMLTLADLNTNQRVAEGRTTDELAKAAGCSAERLTVGLKILESRSVRLLETHERDGGEETRWRLPHERIIPALRKLTGQVLAEADQARLQFDSALLVWENGSRNKQYLLRGAHLRTVLRYRGQLLLDRQEANDFLKKSLRSRNRRRLVVGFLAACSIAIFFAGYRYERWQKANNLVESLLATPAGAVEFYLEKLEHSPNLAIPILQKDFTNKNRTRLQRVHAAYALIRFGSADSEQLKFLLDSVPTLPKDEGVNLIDALERMHHVEPLDEELELRVDQASSDLERNRFLAVQLSLGITDKAAAVCNLHDDPTLRTSFILGFKEFPGDLEHIAQIMESTDDADLRSALCAAVGRLGIEASEATQPVLKRFYVVSPDGGTHSGADWALRQQGLDQEELLQLVQSARDAATEFQDNRDWQLNTLNITMMKIPAREFAMGPVDDDQKPPADAPLEQFTAFWLSDREVSVEQFYAVPNQITQDRRESDMVNPQLAMTRVSWFDAVEFCNELSKQEEMAPYYRLEKIERGKDGSIESADITAAVGDGYRLPTEKEWEYACRALSTTDYSYGNDFAWLDEFAVYRHGTERACGTKLPNRWGLFDMHGNVYEWCWDEYDIDTRVLRGGSFFSNIPQYLYSAYRDRFSPDNRDLVFGFRISRTP